MMHKIFQVAVLALATLAAPMELFAQEAAAPEAEAEMIAHRLLELQQQAMQDTALQAAQMEVGQELVATMLRVEPSAAEDLERANALQAELVAAQQAGDEERLNALASDAQELQASLDALQARAMQDEQMQIAMVAFQEQVVSKMTEIDPETPDLLARLDQLANP
ncbi:hypothetical protein BH23BAC4_BH23BAC4_17590 [soil metagenome]